VFIWWIVKIVVFYVCNDCFCIGKYFSTQEDSDCIMYEGRYKQEGSR